MACLIMATPFAIHLYNDWPSGICDVIMCGPKIPNVHYVIGGFCCLCAAAFAAMVCELKKIKRPLACSAIIGATIGIPAGFLAKTDMVSLTSFVCFLSFALLFWVPASSQVLFRFSLAKRMFEAIMISIVTLLACFLILSQVFICLKSIKSGLNHLLGLSGYICVIMGVIFSPIFTIYKVREDCICENRLNNHISQFEKFVESAFVYSTEFIAGCVMILFLKEFVNIILAAINPKYVSWGLLPITMFLFFASVFLDMVASASAVERSTLRLLQFSKRRFAWGILAVFAAIRLTSLEFVWCLTYRGAAVWLVWAAVVYFARHTPATIIVVSLIAGTLFYFEKQIDQTESRVFAFLEKEQFLKDGVITRNVNMSDLTKFRLHQCVAWLELNEDVIISRLGRVETDQSGQKFFVMKTSKGEVRKKMNEGPYNNICWEFGGITGYCGRSFLERYSLAIPLRFPFRSNGLQDRWGQK
jgi:hypothetical protein